MKKLRLLCVPPYEGMYNLMTNIAAQRSDVELIIHMGNLEDGLKAVLETRDNNIDAVISRGGTAEIIRPNCGDIPVCDIVPSVYDVLRTIRLAQSISDKLAVVGFPSITKPADMLRDIMQYDFEVKTIRSPGECEDCLRALRDKGIQVIIGDMISITSAQKLGMHGLLIVSGIESIEAAIDSAIEMHHYYAAISKRAAVFSDLLASEEADTVIYDSAGQLYYATTNTLAPEITALLRQKLSNVIAQGSLKIIRHLNESVLSIRGRLLQSDGEDFCVYTLSYLHSSDAIDKHMILYLSAESGIPESKPIEYYLGNSEEITAIHAVCDRYASMSAPVLICGERGTGKDCFAYYIYSHSRLKRSSFLVIDVSLLDERGWNFLLKSEKSPLMESGLTIYFPRMNKATPAQRQQFRIYLKNSRIANANRLMFSYTAGQDDFSQDELYLYLTETMHCLQLQIPALAQRREDIPALVGLYINAVNVQYGTQVIGLTHEAMLILQNHVWTRNADQLFQTVRDLVINAKSSYIPEEQVQALFLRTQANPPLLQESSIDLTRPLDEITRDIVLRVYASENMNQTRTAKRLGISRSTLWRMLK